MKSEALDLAIAVAVVLGAFIVAPWFVYAIVNIVPLYWHYILWVLR